MSFSDSTALDIPDENFELTEWDAALRGRRRLFVLYYCTDKDCFMKPIPAYQKAYARKRNGAPEEPSYDTAVTGSWKLMRRPEVKEAIRKLLRRAQEEIDDKTTYEILQLYKELALYNPADIIDINGEFKVKDLSELGEKAKCITGITKKIGHNGLTSYEIKLADRFKAMDSLAKYLELIRPEGGGSVNVPIMIINPKEKEPEMINVTQED